MAKVIICVHGRSNKPPKDVLLKGWRSAIQEGMEKNGTRPERIGRVPVKMAYYADIKYEEPMPPNEDQEPYRKAKRGALNIYDENWKDKFLEIMKEYTVGKMAILERYTNYLFSDMLQEILRVFMEDLAAYLDAKSGSLHDDINQRVEELILEHRQDEIILISHSMGTLVAYDVMRKLGKKLGQQVEVAHFITLGSPLGLWPIKAHLQDEYGGLRTPTIVTQSWCNFSAKGDVVCWDSYLYNDYKPNSRGIKVKDDLVLNDYPGNPHKSYGYLRTPEFSHYLASLL